MILECPHCGELLNAAGATSPKPYGTRPTESGRVPADGRYEWGHYTCHSCDRDFRVPAADEATNPTDRG